MTIRNPIEVLPTMKIDCKEASELEIPFRKMQAKITDIKDIETKKFGTKTVVILEGEEEKFNVFLNNYSLEKLSEAWGNDDKNWKNRFVDLSQEKDKKYNKEMIVLNPVD